MSGPTSTPAVSRPARRRRLPPPLPRRFFARDAVVVARALVGHLLVHVTARGVLVGRIVETEAYRGADDPASHAFRRTPRSAIMFGRPGLAYVYQSYGVHLCLNVVTNREAFPGAVLLRALEPLAGVAFMAQAAGATRKARPLRLASGPGRLTAAMGVGRHHNGADLTTPPLYLAHGGGPRPTVVTGRRIGVSAATDRPWRFGLAGHPSLSRPFAAALAPDAPRAGL